MKKLTIVLGMILAISVVSGFPCYGQQNSIIYGCYPKKQGQLRIVTNPNSCKRSEIPISWNIKGSGIPTISGSWTGVSISGEQRIQIDICAAPSPNCGSTPSWGSIDTTMAYRPIPFTATVTQTGSNISGTLSSNQGGSSSFNGTIDSLCRLSFTTDSGDAFDGKVSGDMMFGTFSGPDNGLMMGIGPQTTCP